MAPTAAPPLGAGDFTLSVEDDSNLIIELSDSGRTVVEDQAEGQVWIVDVVLTTVEFDGKETFEIYNRATLYGQDDAPGYWNDDDVEATSFGDEAELRKRVYDPATGNWVAELDALIEDGEFVNDHFFYAIELIPRGNYGSAFPVTVDTFVDNLPDAIDFRGFVDVDDSVQPVEGSNTFDTVTVPGNLQASYDGDAETVTFQQQPGTNLDPGAGQLAVFFEVQAAEEAERIVNRIANSEAIITPYEPSIDIEKWNEEGEQPEYDESGALLNDGYDGDFDAAPGKALEAGAPLPINFTISNDGGEDLVDVVVSDELTGGVGEIQDLVCTFPDGSTGTAWGGPFEIGVQFECIGTLPALSNGHLHSNTAQVTATGITSERDVEDEDDWHAWVPTPSIDIEKWNVETEGVGPEYDESGALLNDGYDGDFDAAPGKALEAGAPLPINFTISNDGGEDLIDVVVSDELTGGVGEIQDLVCTFPDGTTGTTWDGPFEVGTQFECTGTLPELAPGETHSNTAAVVGVGIHSGTEVDDEDDWHGYVPTPSVGIEKWNDEGEVPEYDEAGALLNDGFDGDFDEGDGKELTAGQDQQINFTISNDGAEDLIDITVTDELTDGAGEIQDLLCTFPDGTTGTTWDGPFEVGTQFECTGTLPGLDAEDIHSNTAYVIGTGAISGVEVGDEDHWNAFVPEDPVGGIPTTGTSPGGVAALAVLVLLTGGGALLYSRRKAALA